MYISLLFVGGFVETLPLRFASPRDIRNINKAGWFDFDCRQ
jgi:hypothetical protein